MPYETTARGIIARPVMKIDCNNSIETAFESFLEKAIGALPVVDQSSQLVGMLPEGDILGRTDTGVARAAVLIGVSDRRASRPRYFRGNVKDLMRRQVVPLHGDAILNAIVALRNTHRKQHTPPWHLSDGIVGLGGVFRNSRARSALWTQWLPWLASNPWLTIWSTSIPLVDRALHSETEVKKVLISTLTKLVANPAAGPRRVTASQGE